MLQVIHGKNTENSNLDGTYLGDSIYSALGSLSISNQKYMGDDIFIQNAPTRQTANDVEKNALALVKHVYADSLKTSDRNPNSRLASGGGNSKGNQGRVGYDPL